MMNLKVWRGVGCSLFVYPMITQATAGEIDEFGPLAQGISTPRSDSPWSASVGAGVTRLGRLSYAGSSQSSLSALPSFFSSDATSDPAIGVVGENGDRAYNNGFVNQSAVTPATGLTSFWGYDNAEQIDGDELSFSATGSRTNTLDLLSNNERLSHSDNVYSAIGRVEFQYELPERVLGMKALMFSFSYASNDSGFSGSNFSGSQGQETFVRNITDTFALGEVALNPPAPGFRGTFAGPNALIPNQPEGRGITETLASTEVTSFANSVSSSADIGAFGVNFGPVFGGEVNDRFYWTFSAGISATIYDWDTKQRESLSTFSSSGFSQQVATFNEDNNGTDIGIGLFARASLYYKINDTWFLNSQLQGDVGNTFDLGSGSSAFEFEPNGYSLVFGGGLYF